MAIIEYESGEDGIRSEMKGSGNEAIPAKKEEEKESEGSGTGKEKSKGGRKKDYEDSAKDKDYWKKYCMGRNLDARERQERGMATLFVLVMIILLVVAVGHPLYKVNFKLQKVEYEKHYFEDKRITIDLFNAGLKKAENVNTLIEFYSGTRSDTSSNEPVAWFLDSEKVVGTFNRYRISLPKSFHPVFTVLGPHTVVITVSWEDGSETFVSTLEYP